MPRYLIRTLMPVLALVLLAACSPAASEATPTPTAEPPTGTPLPPSPLPTVTPSPSGPVPDRIVDRFGVEMVLIPEGIFVMGSDSGDAHESPAHEVFTDAYYIDVYEATNALYQSCQDVGACSDPSPIAGYSDNPDFADYPAVNISWYMAVEFCAWRGGRLPTEAEWEKAARWDPATGEVRTYPWGEQAPNASFTNTASAGVDGTTPTGYYERGASPSGIYDMAGNVWEWVADFYAGDYYRNSPGINPTGSEFDSGFRILRGGGWNDDDYYARTTARVSVGPATSGAWSGVRCARDV